MKNLIYTILALMLLSISLNAQNNTINQLLTQPICISTPVKTETTIEYLAPPTPSLVTSMDSDGDGLTDIEEGFPDKDSDGDGEPDYLDLDSDNNGVPDALEWKDDIDGDGVPNFQDPDNDGDGVDDHLDKCPYQYGDASTDGCPEEIVHRNVYWVHGYRGNENSFEKVAAKVNEDFLTNSEKVDYSISQESLSAAADNLEDDISRLSEGHLYKEKNFVIAHSLGGLVSRTMNVPTDDSGKRIFNGLITFGTPHQGAASADILVNDPEKIKKIFTKACNDLGGGPVAENLINIPYLGAVVAVFGLADNVTQFACDKLSLGVIPILEYAETGIEPELTTNASQAISPMATDHNAVFFGIEDGSYSLGVDGTLTPRFAGSIWKDSNSFSLYGADAADQEGLAIYQQALDFYNTKYDLYQNMSLIKCVNFLAFRLCTDASREIALEYYKGLRWVNNVDKVWQELTGSLVIENVGVDDRCYCLEEDNFGNLSVLCSGPCETIENCGPCDQVDVYQSVEFNYVYKDTDGFILAESAMNAPGMNYVPRKMEGSNHLQMKNDDNMKDAVDAIFIDGLDREYFKTDKR